MLASAIHHVTQLLIGFSVIAAVVLLFAYLFFLQNMQKSVLAKVACTVLLLALTGLQLFHFAYFSNDLIGLFGNRIYVVLLLTVPPAFYFFSRTLLLPESQSNALQLVHAAPVILATLLPVSIVVPVALTIGAGYSVWLVRVVFGMRRHIARFRFELFFFGFFAVLALLVLALFILVPYLDESVFYVAYSTFTGLAFVLIVAVLIVFPDIVDDIATAARMTYAKSTLNDVDIDAKSRLLERVMSEDKLFQNESLNLKMLAEAVGLSGHQVSELLNTRFGTGFSQFVRERRIAEAKRLLVEDKGASILSISMATGFRSQSNFYAAFKDIAGVSPGSYRQSPD